MNNESIELSKYRLQKAREDLDNAAINLDNDFVKGTPWGGRGRTFKSCRSDQYMINRRSVKPRVARFHGLLFLRRGWADHSKLKCVTLVLDQKSVEKSVDMQLNLVAYNFLPIADIII